VKASCPVAWREQIITNFKLRKRLQKYRDGVGERGGGGRVALILRPPQSQCMQSTEKGELKLERPKSDSNQVVEAREAEQLRRANELQVVKDYSLSRSADDSTRWQRRKAQRKEVLSPFELFPGARNKKRPSSW